MKAREIIPGWPKGKSTASKWVSHNLARDYVAGKGFIPWRLAKVMQDFRFQEDVQAECIEESRKSSMMNNYYADELLGTVSGNELIYERLCRILDRPCHLPGRPNRLMEIL